MIVALTMSALVGAWSCTSPDQPHTVWAYAFARNGTGSFTQIKPAPGQFYRPEHFTFRVTARGVFMQSPGHALVNEDISVHGNVLEDRSYFYWNPPEWLVPPSWNRYTCMRTTKRRPTPIRPS